MSPLDRKLLRDIWRIKSQAAAIGVVIAVGVLMLVMMSGLVSSLEETRRAYYERYRLAEVFAPVTRAPESMIDELADLPGVAAAEGRVAGDALIDIKGLSLPLQARVVSLPDYGAPTFNDVFLTDGRRPEPGNRDEILLLTSFARAHGIKPGQNLRVTIRGAQRELRVVGLAQSPEFLYLTPPGEIAPDDSRFAVVWMGRATAQAAYDMEGAFNEALLSLARGAREKAVLDAVNRRLERFGGLGAYGREDHLSDRYVSEEIRGLRSMSAVAPPIFLGVAAFLLHIVVARMVQAERGQIGLMKAFGYTNLEVGAHYLKLVLIIAIGGAIAGCLAGIAAGRAMVGVYLEYYKFPFLVFEVRPSSFVMGFVISTLSASAGGLLVLRNIFALTPAAAMRPPAPADYSRTGHIADALAERLDQPSRMVLRRLMRQPGRMAGAVMGIAAGMAISAAMTGIMSGFDETMDLNFNFVDRSDATIAFVNPTSDKTILELQRMPGVIAVEPVRNVQAVLRNGLKSHRGTVEGRVPDPRLNRALDTNLRAMTMRKEGVILAASLARKLDIEPGQMLTVEVREGRRPVLQIPVIGVTESLLGSPAYMELDALNRALREPGRVSGASLKIDTARSAELHQRLKNMPAVAGVSLKSDARESFRRLMDSGAGAMRYVMAAIAFIITFGIVYNSARIAQAECERDLASLRVIGFSKWEAAFVLLGELAVVALVALPAGALLGYALAFALAAGFSSDLYQIPVTYGRGDVGIATLAVLAAALLSGWLVKRDIDRTDLIVALKTRD
ncbi:ABC transporter permease [Phenylobacterium koreense]|uniref:ABC transport system permease protein n=1 Tax=Phenylobacterium koreense TaxID=266125 RepID=A0ABV2EP00_9CAUL